MKIYFIRHLKTKGNIERRYIGSTDEPLFKPETQPLINISQDIEAVFSSPMRRCAETAALLFPCAAIKTVKDLRELDFGGFEGKSYEELKDRPEYKSFIGSAVTPPGGEAIAAFKERTVSAFLGLINKTDASAAIVLHGGSIMAIMERLEVGGRGFYGYQIENGCAFLAECNKNSGELKIIEEIKP